MTPSDPTSLSVYERCDPGFLRDLREAAGMDIYILARNACLSVGQVRELESGQNGHFFYSDTIKRQAYKRVAMLLGAAPPQASTAHRLTDPPLDLDARLAPLDSIAAMSHRPLMERSTLKTLQPYFEKLNAYKSTIGLFVLLALALAGMTQYLRQHLNARANTPTSSMIVETPTATATATPAPAQAVADVAATPAAEFKCAYSNDVLPQWTPTQARKEGRYVHLLSGAAIDVCVVDAQKRTTHLQMKAGESQSVYGTAPWQISGSNLQKIKIYFQGGLVMLPQGAQALSLVEAPVTP